MSNGPDSHPGTWLAAGVLLGLALALLLGVLAVGVARARRNRRPLRQAGSGHRQQAPAAAGPEMPSGQAGTSFAVDDLPGFGEQPPGSTGEPGTLASAPPADRTSAPASDPGATPDADDEAVAASRSAHDATVGRPAHGTPDLGRAGTTAIAVAVLLLVAAIGVAYAGGPVASARSRDAATTPTPTASPHPSVSSPAAQPTPATATATAAAALAFESVPLGEDGVAAGVTVQGVVLEQRAVGLTVTYPSVSVSTDGRRSLAHVRLPTFNCLTADPPPDPVAAGCVRSLTEYADQADPQLQLSWDGDRIELAGRFQTYVRPTGSAPEYTGRAYELSATISRAGPRQDGSAPAAGVVRIGLDSATTTPGRGIDLLQFPD
jgi:hypothetical protein